MKISSNLLNMTQNMDQPDIDSEDQDQDQDQEQKAYLSNLTIVVPTYHRPNDVLKTIKFWSGKGPRLVVLDGSPTPVKDEGLFDSVKGLTYVHLPESIQFRLAHCAQYIQTDYVTLMGDDEVLMPSSLAASMQELDHYPELASCLGWSVGFRCRGRQGSVARIEGFPGYSELHFLDNNQESAQERLLAHFGRYVPSNVYSVVRANAFRNALKMINVPGERFYGIAELEYEIAILYQGGNRVLPNLHWLRNEGDSGGHGEDDPDTNPKKLFFECFLDPEYSGWREEFLSTRSQILAAIDGQEATQVRIWLEDALQLYSEKGAQSQTKPKVASRFSFLLRKFVRTVLTADQRYEARKVLNTVTRKSPNPSLQEYVRNLSSSGMDYSAEELAQVMEERFRG
jgi:glycosyltransferase domain-containing protein